MGLGAVVAATPKVGAVRMREAVRFAGSVREVTVSRQAGRWYAAFSVEDGVDMPAQKVGPITGVDVGVKTLATASEAVFADKDSGDVAADRWYPSSKTCCGCGAVKEVLLLSERAYV